MDPKVPSQVIQRSFIIQGNANFTRTKMSATQFTELVNDAETRLTNGGKDFILGYSGYEESIVVLGTKEFLQKLCSSDTVYMSCYNIKLESQFKHLFALHCFVDEKLVTMVYALLFNNSKKAYLKMLQIIKDTSHNNNLEFNPSNFYLDVDYNIVPAIEEMFGFHNKIIKISLNYYVNKIWKKVLSLGLSMHNGDNNIDKTILRIFFLALVPLEKIAETWTTIKTEAPQNENLLELISYITDKFIICDGALPNQTVWNHYDTDNIKSINGVVKFHNFIDNDINYSNLSSKNCIIKLKNMQEHFEMDISNPVSNILEAYKFLEERFNHAKEKLENGTISAIEYLDEIP